MAKGKEAFVVCDEGTDCKSYVNICENINEVNDHLSGLSPLTNDNATVLHGILTSATYIPPNVEESEIYIIIHEAINQDNCEVITFTGHSADELARKVEDIVGNGTQLTPYVTIDDIDILYGYESELCLAVDEDTIEDGAIDEISKSLYSGK